MYQIQIRSDLKDKEQQGILVEAENSATLSLMGVHPRS
jgi:hypothetical protein